MINIVYESNIEGTVPKYCTLHIKRHLTTQQKRQNAQETKPWSQTLQFSHAKTQEERILQTMETKNTHGFGGLGQMIKYSQCSAQQQLFIGKTHFCFQVVADKQFIENVSITISQNKQLKLVNVSSNYDSFTLKNLKSTVIVITFTLIILNITIVQFIVCLNFLPSHRVFFPSKFILMLKIIPKSWVLIIRNSLKFFVGIKTKYHGEAIVQKTKDRIRKSKHLHTTISRQITALLYRYQEVSHEIHCKEYTNEDVHHYHLITHLSLDNKQDEEKENTKDTLLQERRRSHEVQNYHYGLNYHQHTDYRYVSTCLFSCRLHGWAQTHNLILKYCQFNLIKHFTQATLKPKK